MRKLKLILATLALVLGWSNASAQTLPTVGAEVAVGEYYIYNIATGKYLNKGVAYGTHADVDGAGCVITLSGSTDNFAIHFTGIAAEKYFATDGYVDSGTSEGRYTTWSFESASVAGYTNVYKIKANKTSAYLYWANSAGNAWANEAWLAATPSGESTYVTNAECWLLIPRATREAYSTASLTNFIDATWRLKDPDFEGLNNGVEEKLSTWDTNDFLIQCSVQDSYSGIFAEGWVGQWHSDRGTQVDGGNYHLSDRKQSQSLTDLPYGKYRLTMTAGAVQEEKHEDISGAFLFAGATTTSVSTRGSYYVDFTFTGTSIEIGFKTVSTTANWVSFDNTRLAYIDPYISAIATTLPDGGAITAEQWYKYVVAADAEYTISATTAGDIIVTTNGSQFVSEATGSALTTGSAVSLTAGTYYYKSSSDNTLEITINDPIQPQRDAIIANKGDLTSLVNGTFQDNTNGWTGGSHITWVTARGWRGDNATRFYEKAETGAMSYTLNNMPAGTYKVVAAARGYDGGTITPEIAGTKGTTLTCIGDTRSEKSSSEINTNGVEMPYSSLGGFTTDANGHNWKWITATGTLAADGDLVINFNCVGNQWMCIDDVHLYCTNLEETSYTTALNDISANADVSNTGNGSVVTCDIIVTNPNVVFKSNSGAAITTAAEQNLNNCLYNTSAWYMTKMVLYDGYAFEDYRVSHGGYQYFATANGDNSCTLYRNIPKDTWCTLTIPFWPKTTLTKMYPSGYNSGTGFLTFSNVTNEACWNNEPMLIMSTSDLTAITGKRAGTNGGGSGITYGDMTSGVDVPMTGVYANGNVPTSTSDTYYYAIDSENNLLRKVTGSEVTIAPFRAYFTLDKASGARNFINLNFGDETTEISQVKDGQFINEGIIYNLRGQRVSNPAKGLYIMNGKKVIIK